MGAISFCKYKSVTFQKPWRSDNTHSLPQNLTVIRTCELDFSAQITSIPLQFQLAISSASPFRLSSLIRTPPNSKTLIFLTEFLLSVSMSKSRNFRSRQLSPASSPMSFRTTSILNSPSSQILNLSLVAVPRCKQAKLRTQR